MSPPDLQAAYAATLVDEWVRGGVTDAVVAPGSRSTPLLDALAADERIRIHVALDERVAGFMALGLGRATGRPALAVTTSGTAAVELHPAVVEAHHGGVPLLVLTADRPPELHGVGAPQTVEQRDLFGGTLRFVGEPGVADEASVGSWRSMAARALAETTNSPAGPGPVHLNLAFREPLLANDRQAARSLIPPGRPNGAPWHVVERLAGSPPPAQLLDNLAAPGQRGIIVAGEGSGDPDAVAELAEATGWPVFADPRSGCRVPGPATIAASDSLLRTERFWGAEPDVVVCLGRPAASKVLGQWLARSRPEAAQVLVDPYGQWADPHRSASQVVAVDPTGFCRSVAARARLGGAPVASVVAWATAWHDGEAIAQRVLGTRLQGPEVSEPGVARTVLSALEDGSTLVTASSMPVRDVEWWGEARRGVRVLCNRGANGIDGTVATALGVALAAPDRPVVALLGDLAFVYDVGALLWAPRRAVNLTLVVVDNNGGGIFSFLPQATAISEARFESLWATPHDTDLGALAAAYGVASTEVATLRELRHALGTPVNGVRVILARSDRKANVALHAALHQAIAEAISSAEISP